MVDTIYLLIASLLFLACWGLLALCERLMEN